MATRGKPNSSEITLSAKKEQTLRIKGTDSIFLSGRKDVTIPLLGSSSSNFPLLRHGLVKSEFLRETFPRSIRVRPKQTFTLKASGTIDFLNGTSGGSGPDGGTLGGSDLFGLGGVSGYKGPTGALVGVFLRKKNPSAESTPEALNFTGSGQGKSFTSLKPKIGQVFFIGDGLTGTGKGKAQKFTAPKGATRLFLGIADGFSFKGEPGAYEDNDGSFKVSISRVSR